MELDNLYEEKSQSSNGKIDDIRKELFYLLKEMKKGKLMLDPRVPLKKNDGDSPIQISKKDMKSESNDKSRSDAEQKKEDDGEMEKSALPMIKGIFDDLHNSVWLMKKSRNKSGLLLVAQKNLVYMILQIIDYTDRNAPKFRKNKKTNTLAEEFFDEDEVDDDQDDQIPEEDYSRFGFVLSQEDRERKAAELEEQKRPKPVSRREVLKEKLRRVVLKNIKSLKTCLKRRYAAKSYPESNEIVIAGCALLNEICSSSPDNKAMLFTEDSWYHFDRLYRKHPLKT